MNQKELSCSILGPEETEFYCRSHEIVKVLDMIAYTNLLLSGLKAFQIDHEEDSRAQLPDVRVLLGVLLAGTVNL